jgi:hypothetical protein
VSCDGEHGGAEGHVVVFVEDRVGAGADFVWRADAVELGGEVQEQLGESAGVAAAVGADHPIAASLAIFAPLAAQLYRRRTTD